MARAGSTGSARHPWISHGIRGWRVELGLFVLSFSLLGTSQAIVAWGPYFLLGCTAFVLWRRPDLRERYRIGAIERRSTHRLTTALMLCEIVGRTGATPTVTSTKMTSVGPRYELRIPPGLHAELLDQASPTLAAALGARKVLVAPTFDDAGLVTLTEVRIDPLPEIVASSLLGVQEAEAYTRVKTWHNDHDLIFTSTIGTPIDPEWFGRTVPKFTKEAGLGHWSIHELRHSCASLLMAMEVPLEVISDQLGHASIRVTSDVYGHLLPRSKAKAAAAMESVLFGTSTEVRPPASTTLETNGASEPENNLSHPLPPGVLVGRPGLDPGTLGLKVPCSSG